MTTKWSSSSSNSALCVAHFMIRYTIAAAMDSAIIAASTVITATAHGGYGCISTRYCEAGNMKYVE